MKMDRDYFKEKECVYELRPGMQNVIPVDLDADGDKDLFYFGNNLKPSTNNSYLSNPLTNNPNLKPLKNGDLLVVIASALPLIIWIYFIILKL